MIQSGEEILLDIDETLDQLIENTDVIKRITLNSLYTSEVEALQKTQESLLARLVHMNDLLKDRKDGKVLNTFESIEHKIIRFGKLNARMINHVASKIKRAKKNRQPRVRTHRKVISK